MTDLRPGDEVLIVLNNADTDRAAAFCQIQGKDDEAVEYILETLPTEFAARQQQQQLGTGMEGRGETALAVGDIVVVHCAMEGTCYRGVVLELPGGGQAEVPVLQMDFGTVVKVKIISYLLRIQMCILIEFGFGSRPKFFNNFLSLGLSSVEDPG
jgi:hypothetical protein